MANPFDDIVPNNVATITETKINPFDDIVTQPKQSVLSYIKEHPFKTVLQPVSKTLGGKTIEEKFQEKVAPFIVNPKTQIKGLPAEIQPSVIAGTIAGVGADVADLFQTPASYIPIPAGKVIGKTVGKIPIKGTTLGEIATKVPVGKGFKEGIEALGKKPIITQAEQAVVEIPQKSITQLAQETITREVKSKEPSITELAENTLYPKSKVLLTAEEKVAQKAVETKKPFQIVKEILTDIVKSSNKAGAILTGEKGNIPVSVKQLAEQEMAQKRLVENMRIILEESKKAGKDLDLYLKELGIENENIAKILKTAGQTIPVRVAKVSEKYAENINLNRLPENVRTPIAELVKDKPIIGQTPHITHEELIATASKLKGTPTIEYLMSKPEGTLAAEALKARQGSVATINEILSKDLGELSTYIKTEIEPAVKELRRVGAELGRALEQQSITPIAKQNIAKKINQKILAIDKDPLFAGTQAGANLKKNLNILARDIIGEKITPNNFDKAYFIWLNSILSDPRTHMVNVASNTLFALTKIPEKFASAIMDLPLTGLGKLGVKQIGKVPLTGKRQVFFGEVPAMIKGLLTKGIKSPEAIGSKFEQIQMFAGDKWLPTGWLKQEDIWAKNVVGRMEMFAKMYQAKATGQKGLVGLEKVRQEQLYRTFQNQPGSVANWIMKGRNIPFIGPALFRWIMPFVKTPANILNAAIERTPAGLAFLGKATTQEQLSQRLAYLGLGSTMSAWAGINYLKGNITGDAPKDPAERDAFYAMGKQPNAIKVFGHWIPFDRLEPVGTALSLIVNTIQDYKTSDKEIPSEKVMDAVGGLAYTLTNKSYFQGMTNLIKSISDPDRYASVWGANIISGGVTPGMLNYFAQLKDPYIRQPVGVKERIMSRVPGLSKQVSPKLTVFGEPIKRETAALPLRITKEKSDLVREELSKIGVAPGFPQKRIGTQKITQKQYTQLLSESGQTAKRALEWTIAQPQWQKMTDSEKEKAVDKIMSKTRELPREKLAYSILLEGIKEADTEQEKRDFLRKMRDAKILTNERFDRLLKRKIL